MDIQHQVHPIPPLYDASSEVLVLGSFPSQKSRESNFFYGHHQNRFWRVMSAILNEKLPESVDDKKNMLLKHNVAVWDVIASCDIKGSSDSSIVNVVPNDIEKILLHTNIKNIFVNGKTAYKLYKKYTEPKIHMNAVCLPSTSPANAAWSEKRLIEEWRAVSECLGLNNNNF